MGQLDNTQTYMHGCGFGVAVFESIGGNEFNPNVALEVGYMTALQKPVLILKDRNLAVLQTDLIGRIYREFDADAPEHTIPRQISEWLRGRLSVEG